MPVLLVVGTTQNHREKIDFMLVALVTLQPILTKSASTQLSKSG
ncbi:hypothetical protein [Microscilla marina]|uniref:Uncharacterized protein n=1 Tax=Microscilla marina ATCC 23134 TaxID=313606 RepID=A1ZUL6_MICM2|nr:hypothetical protein [Microscilla marina]EAY25902.1 hypothetical protein M23134_00856 [Microscilla marina ATCC 23134]